MKIIKRLGGVLLLSLLVSACGVARTEDAGGPAAGTAHSTEGSNNKTLTMAIAAETTQLSPLYMGNQNFCVATLVYENLVNYENGEIVPGLAGRWEFSEDGCSLTFYLRPEVQFHDGSACDARAIKQNLEHKQSNPSFYTLKAVTDIREIELIDETTLTLHYDHPYFAYLNDFCWQDVMTMVSPNLLIAGDYQTVGGVSGTGPYVYQEIVAGQYTRFVRNDNYWGEGPYYDEIIVKYIPDSASRIQALKTGEIDLIFGSALLSYEDYRQACQIAGITGQVAEADTRARDITLNAASPLLSDLNIRKAIAHAINKAEISEGLTYGYEGIAEIPFTLDSPFSDILPEETFNYNPEQAEKLLDDAGWEMNTNTGIREKDGNPLELVMTMDASFDSLNPSLAALLQSQLAAVGIRMKIVSLESMEWFSNFMQGDFDITIWQPQYAYAAPHCWFTPMDTMTPQTISLQTLEGADDFIAAIERITVSDDRDELRVIFTYLYNYNMGNVIDIPLTYSKDMIVYNEEKISGYQFVGTPCFFNIANLEPRTIE